MNLDESTVALEPQITHPALFDGTRAAFAIVDSLAVSSGGWLACFAICSQPRSDDLMFVPLQFDALPGTWISQAELSTSPKDYLTLLNVLIDVPRIATRRGNHIVLDHRLHSIPGEAFTEFEPSGVYSTNSVAMVRRGSQRLVHKVFCPVRARDCDSDLDHSRSAIGGLIGSYYHVEQGGVGVRLLGTLRNYVEGETLDVPLRASLRRMLVHQPEVTPCFTEELKLIERVAEGLSDLQRRIAHLTPVPTVPHPDSRIIADVVRRGHELRDLVAHDPELPVPVRHELASCIQALTVVTGEQAVVTTGGMHGDLHLGHIIVSQNGIDFIDFENFDIASDTVSTPWKDVVALARALEYFSHDELCRAAAELGLGDELSVARELVTVPARRQPEHMRELIERCSSWRARLWCVFRDAFALSAGSTAPPGLLRLLYLQRLFQELRYNYTHARSHFKWFDLYYILQSVRGVPCTS